MTMIVSYRMNGMPKSQVLMLKDVGDLQLAFNRVVQRLFSQKAINPEHVQSSCRYEGRVKIERKKYAAISQGGLIVVSGGPTIPERIDLRT